jgi:dihydrofolate synthase/folylpolyglutamate synthase
VTVITPVSEDHAEHLGPDLASIAREKAGIIKPGVPLVLAVQAPQALAAIEGIAHAAGAPVRRAGRDFRISPQAKGFDYEGRSLRLCGLKPRLIGAHQGENLAVALAVVELLREQGVELGEAEVRRATESVDWPGRLERWPLRPPVLLDGAHNISGAEALAAYLQECRLGKLPWVLGLSGKRRPERICAPWLPHLAAAYVAEPGVDKAVAADEISTFLAGQGCAATVCASPPAALRQALAEWPRAPLVVVAGSLYLVAEVRDWLRKHAEVGE